MKAIIWAVVGLGAALTAASPVDKRDVVTSYQTVTMTVTVTANPSAMSPVDDAADPGDAATSTWTPSDSNSNVGVAPAPSGSSWDPSNQNWNNNNDNSDATGSSSISWGSSGRSWNNGNANGNNGNGGSGWRGGWGGGWGGGSGSGSGSGPGSDNSGGGNAAPTNGGNSSPSDGSQSQPPAQPTTTDTNGNGNGGSAATTSQSPPPAQTSVSSDYQQGILDSHNIHRRNHSVSDLVWSEQMASIAAQIAASCVYAHNTQAGGGGYGQNIGAGAPPADIPAMITDQMYNDEINWYPGYGVEPSMANFEHWGHFSQIVWKSTTAVGCATQYCSGGLANTGGGVSPYFTVCNYSPPGNFGGQYAANVLRPLGEPTVTL